MAGACPSGPSLFRVLPVIDMRSPIGLYRCAAMPQTPEPTHNSEMSPRIKVGDTVAYTEAFLDRQNHHPSDMPAAQGQVKALHFLDKGVILADIEWNKAGLPKRVNIKNLTRTHLPVPK